MGSLFENLTPSVDKSLMATFGCACRLVRGEASYPIEAAYGSGDAVSYDDSGLPVVSRVLWFEVSLSGLGSAPTPVRGDLITRDGSGDAFRVVEVTSIDTDWFKLAVHKA